MKKSSKLKVGASSVSAGLCVGVKSNFQLGSTPTFNLQLFVQVGVYPAGLHQLWDFSVRKFKVAVRESQLVINTFCSQWHKKVTAALLHHCPQPLAEAAAATPHCDVPVALPCHLHLHNLGIGNCLRGHCAAGCLYTSIMSQAR